MTKHKFHEGQRINFKGCKANQGKIDFINENGYYLTDSTFIHFDNEKYWEDINEPVAFRNDEGYIVCLKEGFIAADINPNWHVKNARYVGHSLRDVNGHQVSYYDIALVVNTDDPFKTDEVTRPYVHIFRAAFTALDMADFRPVIYEQDPF